MPWDPYNDFLSEYNPAMNTVQAGRAHPTYENVIKPLRARVLQNTFQIASQGRYSTLNQDDVRITGTAEMKDGSRLYQQEIDLSQVPNPNYLTAIEVWECDCLPAAAALLNAGLNPAVLNMANRQNPGGGAINGAGAQEETIFRRSNIFQSLYQFASYAEQYGLQRKYPQYPLDRDFGGVYSPGVTVFRADEKAGYALLDDPFRVAFVSVAAMRHPELTPDFQQIVPRLVGAAKNKIRTALRIAALHGHDAIVLGALGCGAFRNPPAHVARLFHEVIDEPEFEGRFRRIVFAIIEDHNSTLRPHAPEGNYTPFAREFAGLAR